MTTSHSNGALKPTKGDVARLIADANREMDHSLTLIHRVEAPGKEDDPAEPVKILEVTPDTPASGIMPLYFGPHPQSGQVYPLIIMEIHPSEWEQIQSGRLELPNGWRVGERLFQARA